MGLLIDLAMGLFAGCKTAAEELPTQIVANHTMQSEYKQMCSALGARNALGIQGHTQQSNWFNQKANLHKTSLLKARAQWAACGGTIGGNIPGLNEIPKEYFDNPFGGVL